MHFRPAPFYTAFFCVWVAACSGSSRGAARSMVTVTPTRAAQAPQVTVRQVVESDSLVGRRVRVGGTCALAGSGPSTGAWVLEDAGFTVEVRGLVPRACFPGEDAGQILIIFAQVEPKGPDSGERLLLRLPE